MRRVNRDDRNSPSANAASATTIVLILHALRRPAHRIAFAHHGILIDRQDLVGCRFYLEKRRLELGEIELSCFFGTGGFLQALELGLIIYPRRREVFR